MTFRYARHTNNLEQLKTFYIDVLGLQLLGGFENHDNYDGIFLGKPNENWHLEFTKSIDVIVFNFCEDDLIVFYPNSKLEYEIIQEKLKNNTIKIIPSKNPFWNENGIMILDPDGYRIVISNLKMK
jgi:catechol 2,3-dioxygenase-like lactoylglutathione lyase family enzyme